MRNDIAGILLLVSSISVAQLNSPANLFSRACLGRVEYGK
jgi:hypothetical protein